jgi:hypothetical protein
MRALPLLLRALPQVKEGFLPRTFRALRSIMRAQPLKAGAFPPGMMVLSLLCGLCRRYRARGR